MSALKLFHTTNIIRKGIATRNNLSFWKRCVSTSLIYMKENKTVKSDDEEISTLLLEKYKVLKEEDSPLILDVEEERRKLTMIEEIVDKEEEYDEIQDIDMTRGETGVFSIEQLCDLLNREGAIDVFVAELPNELKYAAHIVIATGRSPKHRKAIATFIRKVYKRKRNPDEDIPRIEGDNLGSTTDWLAMDLGNIILHIFARATREKYDLESLWTLGVEHDLQSLEKDDDLTALLNDHSIYLGDLEPAEPHAPTNK